MSVRAVVGTPSQRCWVECTQVAPEPSSANLPTGIAGAVIGGILGHQIGGGRGQQQAAVGRRGPRQPALRVLIGPRAPR